MMNKTDWGVSEEIPMSKKEATELLNRAGKLYDEGKWQEAVQLIESRTFGAFSFVGEDLAEAKRIMGWSYYYLAIKEGPEDQKTDNLHKAANAFRDSFNGTRDNKKRISITNGLPLVLWVQGEKNDAMEISEDAIKEFPDIPSIWNTRSILLRWGGGHQESVGVCQKVYETATVKEDFKTAGHGKHNKADALVKLERTDEAKKEYKIAIGLYRLHEETTGESAKFHIDGARGKLRALEE